MSGGIEQICVAPEPIGKTGKEGYIQRRVIFIDLLDIQLQLNTELGNDLRVNLS